MGDVNPIRTLRDYSKPSHEGYMNTIKLPVENNVDLLQKVPHHGIDLWLKVQIFYDHVTPVVRRTINQSTGGKLRDKNAKESWALLEDLAFYDNKSWNDPMDFAKPVKAISLPQDVLSTSDRRLIELKNQVQRLMEAHLAPMQSTQLDDTPIRDTTTNPTTQMNFTSTNDPTREKLQGKGIKSPSKLLSPEYLSQSSLAEQNRNPSSLKCVHFINSIVILNKEDEAKEEGNVKACKTEYDDHEMTVESEEGFEEETEDEIEEEEEDSLKYFDTFPTMKELKYHEWILKNPRPPWVKAKVRTGNLNNIKFSCMFGHFDKKQAYLDMESPINGLKVFVRNFTYECDSMVIEDTTSVIDHDLGLVIFEKPFVEATGLVYDKEEGTITFEKDMEKIVFKMPHKMEMFKHIDFTDIRTDRIPPFAIKCDDDSIRKTHYFNSLYLGPEYKHDENVCRAIQSLISMKAKGNKGEVTFGSIRIHGSIHLMRIGEKCIYYPNRAQEALVILIQSQFRFLALGWHLEEIHVTWAHLEKKQTRLRLYTKYLEEPRIQSVETASQV
ncbi:hypothetical protein Tco_0343055 [Tanacetum coccineum]